MIERRIRGNGCGSRLISPVTTSWHFGNRCGRSWRRCRGAGVAAHPLGTADVTENAGGVPVVAAMDSLLAAGVHQRLSRRAGHVQPRTVSSACQGGHAINRPEWARAVCCAVDVSVRQDFGARMPSGETRMSDAPESRTASAADGADEDALVEAAKQGDSQAMNQLLARHWKTVDKLCRRMLRNGPDAEDARQEALMQAARRIATFEGRSSFGTWIYSVTRHVCLNEIQKASRRATVRYDDGFDESVAPRRRSAVRYDDEFDESDAPPRSNRNDRSFMPRRPPSADDYGRVAQRLDIDAAMREVSPAYHSVLVMWFFGDMSLSDIAAQLDVPVNTVKTRLFKGKAQLARLLAEPDTPSATSREETRDPGWAEQ